VYEDGYFPIVATGTKRSMKGEEGEEGVTSQISLAKNVATVRLEVQVVYQEHHHRYNPGPHTSRESIGGLRENNYPRTRIFSALWKSGQML